MNSSKRSKRACTIRGSTASNRSASGEVKTPSRKVVRTRPGRKSRCPAVTSRPLKKSNRMRSETLPRSNSMMTKCTVDLGIKINFEEYLPQTSEEPQPSTSTEEPQPSTSAEEPQPSTSAEDPQPSTSAEDPQPSTSAEAQPSTSSHNTNEMNTVSHMKKCSVRMGRRVETPPDEPTPDEPHDVPRKAAPPSRLTAKSMSRHKVAGVKAKLPTRSKESETSAPHVDQSTDPQPRRPSEELTQVSAKSRCHKCHTTPQTPPRRSAASKKNQDSSSMSSCVVL